MTGGFYSRIIEEMDAQGRLFVKADMLERFLAKLIDMLIVGALFSFPSAVGEAAGLTYMLISDGLNGGQSLGKRVIGLKVVRGENPESSCDFKASIIRNAVFGLLIVLWVVVGLIPYVGKVLVALIGAAAVAAEMLLIYTDDTGARFGDRIAGTLVVSTRAAEAAPAD
jgi:uncharacterized RDD family membrane protein YckC